MVMLGRLNKVTLADQSNWKTCPSHVIKKKKIYPNVA